MLGLIVASIYVIVKSEKNFDLILLITLITTGFIGLYMSLDGNFVIFELLLTSAMFFYITRKKFAPASLFLGIESYVKVLPLAFIPLYVFIETTFQKRITIILTCLGSFVLLNIISFLIFPDLNRFYYLAIAGSLNQPGSPLSLQSNNLSFFTLLLDIGDHFLRGNAFFIYGSYAVFCLIILVLFRQLVQKRISQFIEIYSFGMLAIYLILPRIADYTFLLVTIPIYYLMKSGNTTDKIITLVMVSGLPLSNACMKYFFQLISLQQPPILEHVSQWTPFYSLLLFYLFYLYRNDIFPFTSGGYNLDEQ
jgi:hypothetical protein